MDRFEFFKDLGFGEYESKVLSSLVRLGVASPKEVSSDSGVPQNKLYAIFRDLESQGLLARIPSESKKYELINLKGFVDERLKGQEERLRDLRKSSGKLASLEEKERSSFSLIKGQLAVMNKISETNAVVEKEILGVQRNWKVWGAGLRAMDAAVKRGVVVKQIGVVNGETRKRVGEWMKVGVKVRDYNKKFGEFPLRFSVFDRKFARITIGKPEIQDSKDYITIWSDSKSLVNMLVNQFFEMWKECEVV